MLPQNCRRDHGARAPCICAMSWQPSNVKLPACATEWGEGPTVLYGMLVNMDRPLWRQSVGARASLQKLQSGLVLRKVNQGAWHIDRAVKHGPGSAKHRCGNSWRARNRSPRRELMANSSRQIAERHFASVSNIGRYWKLGP